jgi:hypothetical protein
MNKVTKNVNHNDKLVTYYWLMNQETYYRICCISTMSRAKKKNKVQDPVFFTSSLC